MGQLYINLKDRIGFFEMPLWVAKSTLLYDKWNNESVMTLSSGKRVHRDDEATTDARHMVHTLLANGYPFEEVCNMLSLSEKEIELMRGEV
jgi:hypothetical protein